MKLIIWLWNPGKEYECTRHNIWFLFLDWLRNNLNISEEFRDELKYGAQMLETQINWQKTILLKPLTYMNLSGESISKVINFYKIDLSNIIIIYDDISLAFCEIRFRASWSAWGQNWIKSIISYIWEDFKRIKIWIGQDRRFELSDWVLSKFKPEELEKLNKEIFKKASELLLKNL